MNAKNQRVLRRAAAVTGAFALVGLTTSAPALADTGSGSVKVVNTETVQVYMSADGEIQSKRVYEQLALSGHGSVDVKNPISTDGLRNLDGFGGFTVKGGDQIAKTTVDGTKRYRSVSNFDGTLPVSIKTSYTLNGKKVAPGDIVGKSGKLAVQFVVANKTSKKQEVTLSDGSGGTVTKTVDVPVPMVGSLTTTAPKNFTNVDPGGASTAGDGTGGTTMSYTMTLFPPLGSDTATLGYTADITNGVVPRVDVALLPVDPLSSPTFKTAGDSYKGGADTGAQLVTGATTIDTNLLKLRDGASQLLAGLVQLSDGADQLHSGLADDAAPGAKKLAAGTGDALDGSEKLAAGAKKLKGGLSTANGGGTQLDQGAKDLLAGQKALAGGLKQLYAGVQALPASVQTQLASDVGYQSLLGALSSVVAGIGTANDLPTGNPATTTLMGGLNGIKYGMRAPGTTDCATTASNCGLADGLDTMKSQLDSSLAGAPSLVAALETAKSFGDCSTTACSAYINNVETSLSALAGGLGTMSAKLGVMSSSIDDQLIPGVDALKHGLSTGANPATCATSPAGTCGVKEAVLAVKGGIPQLVQGLTASIRDTLLANIGTGAAGCDPTKTLQCGANALSAGTQQLADGVSQLVAGLGLLSSGGSQLASGAGDLADGLGQIDTGATKLSDGLGDAADGSGKIADGLKTAADGAPQIVDGASRLSTEGMGQLKQAGESTAVNYGEMYAVIKAGSERAHTSAMAFGAPKGAEGLTAYAFTITGEDGQGSHNLTRSAGALVLLGLGAGTVVLRRRVI